MFMVFFGFELKVIDGTSVEIDETDSKIVRVSLKIDFALQIIKD
jgi:hypothetical protein